MSELLNEIKEEEGFSTYIYKCTRGFDTCGYGYNLQANPLKLSALELREVRHGGVSEGKATIWLMRIVAEIEKELNDKLRFFKKLDEVRQNVLIQMAYQMGVEGLLEFKNTLHAIEIGDYNAAAKEMLHSAWAKQTVARAARLAVRMRNGI